MSNLASVIIGNPDDDARIPQWREGVVTSVSPLLVRVGSAVTSKPCNALASYVPQVGDAVSVLVLSGDRLVLGTVAATSGVALGRLWSGSSWDAVVSSASPVTPATGQSPALALSAGRKYLVMATCDADYGTVVGDGYTISVNLDGVSTWSAPIYIEVANQYVTPFVVRGTFTTTTGNHTVSCWARRDAGTGALQFRGRLWLYDEGPA